MKKVVFEDLGENKNYQEIWDFQDKIFNQIIKGKKEKSQEKENLDLLSHLLFVTHPHVYTLGKNGKLNHLLADEEFLSNSHIDFINTNRGGDITYHGPGQLVVYPIIDLDEFKPDINFYLRNLEEIVIRVLAEYGLKGERSKGETGVWLEVGTAFARKICAIGVKASRWVTMHGFALNINTDLRYYDYIIPCGIKGKSVTSMERELNKEISMNEVKEKIKKQFEAVFVVELIPNRTSQNSKS